MSDSVIRATGLGKTVGGKALLRDVNIEVATGRVVGLIGKNGAGKTTLFDLLLGFSLPTSGTCSIQGHDSAALPADVKARIGFVPQQDELIAQMTGAQQLDFIGTLHPRWDRALIARLAADWELPLDRRISKLSGGERQKLSTLCALGHRPDLLVLDEPAAALDPVARRRFMQQILEIAGDATRTLVYATHIVQDLERVATDLWMMREGAIVWQGELDQLKESVVRLHLRGNRQLDPALALPNPLQRNFSGRTATVTVSGWKDSQRAPLAQQLDVEIEVEPLGLEEIFLAMHA